MYMPAGPSDPALWHVVHEDGDEEDLEQHEVEEALKLVSKKKNDNALSIAATVASRTTCLICFMQADSEEEEEGADPPDHIHLRNMPAGGQWRSEADGGLVLGSHHLRHDGS